MCEMTTLCLKQLSGDEYLARGSLKISNLGQRGGEYAGELF
jgi:hypothetical protein